MTAEEKVIGKKMGQLNDLRQKKKTELIINKLSFST